MFFVRKGVWGLVFEFEGTPSGSCRELICEFESPSQLAAVAAPAAAVAVAVQAAGPLAAWVERQLCASLSQRSNLLLPTCYLHSLCEDVPEEGPEGAVRGGGLFLEQHA